MTLIRDSYLKRLNALSRFIGLILKVKPYTLRTNILKFLMKQKVQPRNSIQNSHGFIIYNFKIIGKPLRIVEKKRIGTITVNSKGVFVVKATTRKIEAYVRERLAGVDHDSLSYFVCHESANGLLVTTEFPLRPKDPQYWEEFIFRAFGNQKLDREGDYILAAPETMEV